MGSCAIKAEHVVCHLKADTAPIMIFLCGWNDRLQLEIGKFADTLESVGNALLFSFQLRLIPEVLPRATTASRKVRTRRGLADRRRGDQATDLADIVARFRFEYARCNLIAGRGARDHYGFSQKPTNPVRTIGEPVYVECHRVF